MNLLKLYSIEIHINLMFWDMHLDISAILEIPIRDYNV